MPTATATTTTDPDVIASFLTDLASALSAPGSHLPGSRDELDDLNTKLAASLSGPEPEKPVLPDIADEPDKYIRPNGEEYVPRDVKVAGSTLRDVLMLRHSRAAGVSALLYGPPGTGKTAMVEAAFAGGLETVQGSADTETADFVGSWVQNPDGNYSWVDGPLVRAMEAGAVLLIDEIALIDPRALAVVYGVMDGRDVLPITQNPARGDVKAAPGFRVFGACNPDVPGAVMSDALLSRFALHVEVATDWAIAPKLGVPARLVRACRNLDAKRIEGRLSESPQMREMLNFASLERLFGRDVAVSSMMARTRPENRADVAAELTSQLKLDETPTALAF